MQSNINKKHRILVCALLLALPLLSNLLATVLSFETQIGYRLGSSGKIITDGGGGLPPPPRFGMPSDYLVYTGFENIPSGTDVYWHMPWEDDNTGGDVWIQPENHGSTIEVTSERGFNGSSKSLHLEVFTGDGWSNKLYVYLRGLENSLDYCDEIYASQWIYIPSNTMIGQSNWGWGGSVDEDWNHPEIEGNTYCDDVRFWIRKNSWGTLGDDSTRIEIRAGRPTLGSWWDAAMFWNLNIWVDHIEQGPLWNAGGTATGEYGYTPSSTTFVSNTYRLPVDRWFRQEIYLDRETDNTGSFEYWLTDPSNPDPSLRNPTLLVGLYNLQTAFEIRHWDGSWWSKITFIMAKIRGTPMCEYWVDEFYLYNYNIRRVT